MENQPHESKSDISNLLKALEDAVYPGSDEQIWRYGEMEKVWGIEGAIIIKSSLPLGFANFSVFNDLPGLGMQEKQRFFGKQNDNAAQTKCDCTKHKDNSDESRQFQHSDTD